MSNKSYLSVYAKSFNWAGFFLPKKTFKKCSALYDFCRVADNIADDDDEIENKEKKFINLKMILIKKTLIILSLKICGVLLKSSIYL